MLLKPSNVLRHSAHGSRTDHKQMRVERPNSVNSIHPTENISKTHLPTDINSNNWKEKTVFLSIAKRKVSDARSGTPLEVQDITEEEDMDSYFFDDPESETVAKTFDEKTTYLTSCEKYGMQPSSTFLRQIDQPHCNLSGLCMTDKDIHPIAVALVNNSKITNMDFSENEIGKRGMHYIAEALSENVFITRASFRRVGIDIDSVKYLVDGLNGNKTLNYLDLSANHLDAKAAMHIAKLIQDNDFIVELVLRENDFDDEAGRILASAIASNLTIQKLDLSWNHIRGKGAGDIITAVCTNVELLDVDLSWNGLGEEGSMAFGKEFHKNHTLRTLDISNTRINFLHLGHVLKGLKGNDTLETLKITGNPFTTDGAIAILKCLEASTSSTLKHLYLEDSPINDEFLEVYEDLKEKKDITVHHKEPNKKKISSIIKDKTIEDYDPLLLMFELMKQENFRLVDLFKTFDENNDSLITKQELKNGLMKFSLELPEDKVNALINKLDLDSNNVIDLQELIRGRRQAAYSRHVACKDTTGRMADSLKHLKVLVEQARKEKYNATMRKKDDVTSNDKKKEQLTRKSSMTAIIQIPSEMTDALKKAIANFTSKVSK